MKKFGENTLKNSIRIIVLGGHVQSYGIVKIFGESNIYSIVIDKEKHNIARHSKYCKSFYKATYDNLIDLLKKFIANNLYQNCLIIPTDDYYVRILSQNRDLLNTHFKVAIDSWDKVNIFFNKRNSYPIVEALGVPIPKTYYPDNINNLEALSEQISFPCIIKPAVVLDFSRHFKKKVFVCNNYEELKNNFYKAVSIINPNELLIQEIIPGSSYNQYSVGLFFNKNESYNLLVARRKRQHPIDFGNATTYAETVDMPILIEYAEKILSKTEFTGICEVEFKYDERDNKFKFLEVNPRTWKWHLISEPAEIPFLLNILKFYNNQQPISDKKYKKAGWRDIITDIPISILMFLKGLKNYKSKTEKNVEAVYNIKDLRPFIFHLIYTPFFIFKR